MTFDINLNVSGLESMHSIIKNVIQGIYVYLFFSLKLKYIIICNT